MAILSDSIGTLKVAAGACWTVYSSLNVSVELVSVVRRECRMHAVIYEAGKQTWSCAFGASGRAHPSPPR